MSPTARRVLIRAAISLPFGLAAPVLLIVPLVGPLLAVGAIWGLALWVGDDPDL